MFEVGEIAIICLGKPKPMDNPSDYKVDGLECTITRIGSDKTQIHGLPTYQISVDGYGIFDIAEPFLRKKKPPEEEIDWVEKLELKNWNPTKQGVEV